MNSKVKQYDTVVHKHQSIYSVHSVMKTNRVYLVSLDIKKNNSLESLLATSLIYCVFKKKNTRKRRELLLLL